MTVLPLVSLLLICFFSFWLTASSLLPLSQCSVSCGGGVQTRSIQCLRQGRPAAGCLPHQRPVTSRACNTQFCPAAPLAPAHRSSSRVTAAGPALKGIFLRGSKEQIYSASLNDDHIITDMEEIYYWDFIQRLAAQEFARVSVILYQSNIANQLVSMLTHWCVAHFSLLVFCMLRSWTISHLFGGDDSDKRAFGLLIGRLVAQSSFPPV